MGKTCHFSSIFCHVFVFHLLVLFCKENRMRNYFIFYFVIVVVSSFDILTSSSSSLSLPAAFNAVLHMHECASVWVSAQPLPKNKSEKKLIIFSSSSVFSFIQETIKILQLNFRIFFVIVIFEALFNTEIYADLLLQKKILCNTFFLITFHRKFIFSLII